MLNSLSLEVGGVATLSLLESMLPVGLAPSDPHQGSLCAGPTVLPHLQQLHPQLQPLNVMVQAHGNGGSKPGSMVPKPMSVPDRVEPCRSIREVNSLDMFCVIWFAFSKHRTGVPRTPPGWLGHPHNDGVFYSSSWKHFQRQTKSYHKQILHKSLQQHQHGWKKLLPSTKKTLEIHNSFGAAFYTTEICLPFTCPWMASQGRFFRENMKVFLSFKYRFGMGSGTVSCENVVKVCFGWWSSMQRGL